MRVFLMWADKDKELTNLMQALDADPNELVYWVGYEGTEHFSHTNAIFQSHVDAIHGVAARGVDVSGFEPPSADIILKLRNVEALVLTMMNRSHDTLCVDERRRVYYEMLRYWLGVFKTYKPEFIIFPVDPHSVYDYIVYELARLFSIETIMFNETRISDRMLWMNDFRQGSRLLSERIEKNKEKDFVLTDLSPDIQRYYEQRAVCDRDSKPSYVTFLEKKYSPRRRFTANKVIRTVRDGTFWGKASDFLSRKQNLIGLKDSIFGSLLELGPNLKREYARYACMPDMNKKFVYAALQVQPERTTSPLGDMFVDQLLMLETLSASIPDDWVIYVKEHPIQWIRISVAYSGSRYRGYYERISRIPKVQITPTTVSSFALMDMAQSTATITGAPGWEARLRGKPSIIFGHPWYKECPGIFRATDVASCRDAFAYIAKDPRTDEKSLIGFLKSIDEVTIRGYIAASNEQTSTLTRKENMENIRNVLVTELRHLARA